MLQRRLKTIHLFLPLLAAGLLAVVLFAMADPNPAQAADRSAPEICSNELDDDSDGAIDEGACRINTTGSPVSGNGMVPETWNDNPSCSDLGYEYEFKIEGQGGAAYTGTFAFESGSVTLTSDGDFVDWSSTLPLDAVFVKGGPTGGNLYIYDPESTGPDTALSVPGGGSGGGDAISHLTFCYDYELSVEKSASGSYDRTITWELDKLASPDAHGGFPGDSFQSNWTVDVTKNVVEDNYAVNGSILIFNPAPFAVDFSVVDLIDDSIAATVDCGSGTATGTVPANSSTTCSYSAGESDGIDGTQSSNFATVTSLTEGVDGDTATAGFSFTANAIGDETVTVDDDRDTAGQFPANISNSTTFDYDESFECSTNTSDYTEGVDSNNYMNTATLVGENTNLTADADIDVTCYLWNVSKTSNGSYQNEYGWDISKTVDPESQSGFAGDSLEWTWTITWNSYFVQETNHAVSGVITVDNPADRELTVDVTDELTGGLAATVTCNDDDAGADLTVAANSSGTCDYTAAPASQLAQNTASATRNGVSVSDTVDVNWVQGADVGLDATISDSNNTDISVDSAQPYQYTESVDCSTDTSLYTDDGVSYGGAVDNAVTIKWTGGADSDDASASYTCYVPTISKTAEGAYDETHTWNIEKSVDPTSQTGYPGDTLEWDWNVKLTETSSDSNFRVSGVVTVVNPNPEDELVVLLTDTLNGTPLSAIGIAPTATCQYGSGSILTVPAGETATCTYSSIETWDALADAPTQNDVRIHLNYGTDNHVAIKYVASPIPWTPTVYNGTAAVDDNQESDFPTTVNAGEGPWEWTETESHTCSTVRSDYSDNGSYSDTRHNTATVTGSDGQSDSAEANTTYMCETSFVEVLKLTDGVENASMNWNFQLLQDGTTLESLATPPALLEFLTTLGPGDEYTMCETGIPAGWTLQWALDSNGNGVIDDGETLPFVGGVADLVGNGLLQVYDPDPDYGTESAVNDTRCVNFVADSDAGDVVPFIVDNQFPGGEPRTPGYWKNWNTCTNGNQVQTAAANGGPTEGWFLLDDLLPTSVGDFEITTCEDGVSILNKSEVEHGTKMASDPAFNLATALLAAKLNIAAGAETCQEVVNAVADADALLSGIDFDGTAGGGNTWDGKGKAPSYFFDKKDSAASLATELATVLDDYNNGLLCGA